MAIAITENARKEILSIIKNMINLQNALDLLNRNCESSIDAMGEIMATGDISEANLINMINMAKQTEELEFEDRAKRVIDGIENLKKILGTE